MDMTQIPLPSSADAEHAQSDLDRNDNTRQIVADVAYRQLAIVNVIFVGLENAGDGNWVLVDARHSRIGWRHPLRRESPVWRKRPAFLHCHDAWALRSRRRARNATE
ncbi:hypothetical protein ACVWZL_005231 [Bradyrhizobium sp. GM2.4]